MIFAAVRMTVKGNKSTINKDLYMYRNNKNITIEIEIVDNEWVFMQDDSHNVIKSINPTHFTMRWMSDKFVRLKFDMQPIQDGKAIWNIGSELIDERIEEGDYDFQITLHDEDNCSVISLPPVLGQIHVYKHIFEEEDLSIVGLAQVDTAMVGEDEKAYTLDDDDDIEPLYSYEYLVERYNNEIAADGDYEPTEWNTGDIISADKLNNIEAGIVALSKGSVPFIATSLQENLEVKTGENLDIDIDYYSPNVGEGSLKIFVNDISISNNRIPQGESVVTIQGQSLAKGMNRVVIYVLDRAGKMSNNLVFYIRYGGTEFTYEFDPYTAYAYGATVRYYFTPTALDTSKALSFYMTIDGQVYGPNTCAADVRSYFTFPNRLNPDSHYCEAWVEDAEGEKSPVHAFNLIVIRDGVLVVASDTKNVSTEEGNQVSLDYKVYMNNNISFITKVYVDNELVNTGTCGLDTNYYRTSSLKVGQHLIKVEVTDVTGQYKDSLNWTVIITESTFELRQPANAGAVFIGTAVNKTNTDERKQYWVGHDQDGNEVLGTLTNFGFNSESGWVDDKLLITGNSHVEIPIKPLANNARYGFTLDIDFSSQEIGADNPEVLTLWNNEKNCGIKITAEELILRSASGTETRLYYSDQERTNAIFVIDRNEKTAKIYLNGVMCGAFFLSDYVANGESFLEDFTVDSNIILGGYNKNGSATIHNLRVYEIALGTDEIINNWISCFNDKVIQRDLVAFQKGDDLPTLYVYCDFAGLGKDDKKPCSIEYVSTNVEKYGASFSLTHKESSLQYQGTSSMAYPIKNYRLNLRDENGDKWYYDFPYGQPECRFTLKADFMSSSHANNTGLTKWINDNLYNYNEKDEKSMNPKKWFDINNGGLLEDTRECIYGFPCRLILVNDGNTPLAEGQNEPTPGNTKDMGIFNFNNDKDNVTTMGLERDNFRHCMSFEVTANSDTSAGAFMSYSGDGDEADELAYLKESFELRYPDEDEVDPDYGYLGTGEEGTGLKALIDWVDNCTDEEFVTDFEQHFHKDYTLRYYLLVIALGMVDNLGKNMMLDSWDSKIWMPRFYDCDTICSYDNSGDIKFDIDIEMEQGYWNTSSSRLWTRIRDLMHDELVLKYNDMRKNGLSYESLMSYFYDEQISKIPQTYYNKDFDVKYAPFGDAYMGMAHGNGYEHMKRWLKQRLIFCDTLFDYGPSYENDIFTIRANTTELMNIQIETYIPVYQHMSWYNGQMDKKKINKNEEVNFSGTAMAATDQEVLIYGASNVKKITGISSMNPNQLITGAATKLTELDVSNSPLLSDLNLNKANLTPNTYLNKVDLSNCPLLEGNLRINNSPLLRELNVKGTGITELTLPSSLRNLEILRLPNKITKLNLNDASMLHTLEFDPGVNMASVNLSNCNALRNVTNFNLLNTPTITLDNSYNTVAELYFRDTTNLTLRNMANLERVIFTPNNEYETFELINVANAPDYKVTTFNCPKLSTFMTTAPYRESYNNGEYGDIQPDITFTANSIDISSTQFTDVKLLCTTDTNTLKLPTTVKNFYCDSSFDLDTDCLKDGEYDVVHGELVEPYTTDYEGEVVRPITQIQTIKDWNSGQMDANGNITDSTTYFVSDFISPIGNFTVAPTGTNYFCLNWYNEEKEYIGNKYAGNWSNEISYSLANGGSSCKYFRICSNTEALSLSFTSHVTPNLIPSSADGSLIFSMYAPSNAVAPASGTWDLYGLEFDNFHTFGMNNDVKNILEEQTVPVTIYRHAKYIGTENWTQYTGLDWLDLSDAMYTINVSNNTQFRAKNLKTGSLSVVTPPIDIQSSAYLIGVHTDTTTWISFTNKTTNVTYTFYLADMPFADSGQYDHDPIRLDSGEVVWIETDKITMPARYDDYNITIKNAYIAPKTHNTMLYPLLVNEDNPITGTLDYTNYAGKYLSWSFAYTDEEYVNIIQPKDELLNSYEYKYNAFYDTEYEFDNPYEIARYTSSASGVLPTFNSEFTYTYDEMDNGDGTYTTKVYANDLDNLPTWLSYQGKTNLLSVEKLKTGVLVSSECMFQNCTSLTSVNVSEIDVSSVGQIYRMFYGCSKLTEIQGITNLSTGKVANMWEMFRGCSSLTELDVSGFDTSNVTNMSSMFNGCSNLTSLNLSNFNTSNVTNMTNMFHGCTNLTSLNVSGFDTSKVTDMNAMFNTCNNLTSLDVSGFDTSNVTNMGGMFNTCSNLTSLDVSGFDTSNVTTMGYMFQNCSKLTSLDVSGFNTSNVTNMSSMFQNCGSLTSLDVSGFDTSNVTNMNGMFNTCSGLTTLDLSKWNASKVANMYQAFYGCSAITELNLSGFTNVNDWGTFCKGCTNLVSITGLDISKYSTNIGGNVNKFLSFEGCTSLREIKDINVSFTSVMATACGIAVDDSQDYWKSIAWQWFRHLTNLVDITFTGQLELYDTMSDYRILKGCDTTKFTTATWNTFVSIFPTTSTSKSIVMGSTQAILDAVPDEIKLALTEKGYTLTFMV